MELAPVLDPVLGPPGAGTPVAPRSPLRLSQRAQRVLRRGVQELEQSELLALLIGTPRHLPAQTQSARALLALRSLPDLARSSPAELLSLGGLRRTQAARLAAAFELGRRVERAGQPERPCLRSPGRVHRFLEAELRGLEREQFLVLLLDGKHRLRRLERVSEGTLNSSLVHPREVFRAAVRESAAAVIAAHNHPSGDPEPSLEDLEITRRLFEVGKLIGIPLLDHIVIAGERYVSLRQRMGLG